MIWDEVLVVSRHVNPISPEEVAALERELEISLPTGYVGVITRFGEGSYCDLFRIYPPRRILDSWQEQRQRWREQFIIDLHGRRRWFFEGSEQTLTEAQLQRSYVIGDTHDGDVLAFYPADPDRIFMLPRHSDRIEPRRSDFADLHTWDGRAPDPLTFIPFAGRANLEFRSTVFTVDAEGWLARCRAQWGKNQVLVASERLDAVGWDLVVLIPPIGARMQLIMRSGETRIERTPDVVTTILGSGQRSLWITVECDEEAVLETRSFVASLESRGLLVINEP